MTTKLARRLAAAPIDAMQLQQVLVNLIKNAMQAMTKGGTLTLQTGENDDGVWVSVADTGGGIPQEQINRIFEPFYTTKKKGSGLGLMIVQRIVRAHNGRIELESHVGTRHDVPHLAAVARTPAKIAGSKKCRAMTRRTAKEFFDVAAFACFARRLITK